MIWWFLVSFFTIVTQGNSVGKKPHFHLVYIFTTTVKLMTTEFANDLIVDFRRTLFFSVLSHCHRLAAFSRRCVKTIQSVLVRQTTVNHSYYTRECVS